MHYLLRTRIDQFRPNDHATFVRREHFVELAAEHIHRLAHGLPLSHDRHP